ncbi:MAG: serine hydrolase domain-containing protein [Usitatibacter sp.]
MKRQTLAKLVNCNALALVLVALACAPAAAQLAPPEKLAADSPRSTPAGATFTAPAGWTMTTRGNLVVLESPEGDSRLALVDTEGKDATEAMTAAWAAYRPDSKRPLKLVTPQAPINGWEERKTFEYETSPNERKVAFAVAARAGTSWTVWIFDASEPTFEKRGSQFSLVSRSLRPKGYSRETFAGRKAQPLDGARIATLRAFVEDGMKKLGVPGVGLALIDGGKVVYEGGLGVKELGKPAKVDADTLFIAASNTKALTTLLLAELVDEKKLRWDEPVTEAYPRFRLGDAATTKSVLVKHLICACTGMPRQDLEWILEFKGATPASSMALLANMQPTSGFGELFQYSNLMASAAGFIGGALYAPTLELGAAYDLAMRRKVFEPLGMDNTTFDFARALRGNHASPHGKDADGVLRVARMDLNYAIVPARPAGGVWTSAHDLARYVEMELARGKLESGRTLVSEENLLARREPQVKVSEDITYGMGLFIDNQWGVPIVHHGGDLAGYHSDMMWFPDQGVGAVILTNSDPGVELRGPLLRRIAELVFDGKPEAQARLDAAVVRLEAARRKERERLEIPANPALAVKLARHYASKELGTIAVLGRGKDTVFDVGEWKSVVATRRNDDGSVSFITIDPTLEGLEFVVADRDGKRSLVMRDAQHEYTFKEAH